ncbi:50S ribosomal protein L5 [Candidatus Micropelagos thuwalensis]|uniref:Large ribosomal subunit protein uL29 n=1 Tax=Candidatus Micropelagius thuwalensis TaxID=1397666 RepID=U2WU81_9PROT|nr:50S ribosomal protein L29 [Candidatus Micropelagos thuwalensis]ERL47115.1 50S ribosomal protein L5 [Candidatus Micropelagos thuwalensis]
MKIAEIRDLTADQLNDRLVELKKEQFNLRFQKASGQLENMARIGQVRKEIARVQTAKNEFKGKQAE